MLPAIIWLFNRLTTTGHSLAEQRDMAKKKRSLRYRPNALPRYFHIVLLCYFHSEPAGPATLSKRVITLVMLNGGLTSQT
jgi:hypothetical protein